MRAAEALDCVVYRAALRSSVNIRISDREYEVRCMVEKTAIPVVIRSARMGR
jgi:hypothetical protein